MVRLAKFLALPIPEKLLFLRAAILMSSISLELQLLPHELWSRRLNDAGAASQEGSRTRRLPADRIAWAVTAASRYVPRATCLVQALAAKAMLHREGYPAQIHFGVANHKEDHLEAHAWIESEGRVLIGGAECNARYARLATRPGGAADQDLEERTAARHDG